MKKCLSLLLVLLLCAGCALAEEELAIVHATDMHYFSPALHDGGPYFMEILEAGDGKVTHYSSELMQAFVRQMLTLMPDAIILTGDLTLNGEPQSHAELAAMLTPLKEAGIRVLALSGNHDAQANAWYITDNEAWVLEPLADDQFDDVYAAFGYDDALSRDTVSHSYVAELSPQVRVLLVDVNTNGTSGTVAQETLAWIESQLIAARDAGATVIAATHQPALIHNPMFTFGYVINNAGNLTALLRQYGVTLNLAGHLHMQHIAQEDGLTEIVTSSLAVSPLQYGVVRITDGRLRDYATQSVDVSGWAAAEGLADPVLADFAAYAADFFDRVSLGSVYGFLESSGLAEEIQARMLDFVLTLNADYFAGTRQPDTDQEAWTLWQIHGQQSFLLNYMESMLQVTQPMNAHTF
ncbi:MAG: metallophosphoesterase [Clostridia bacterium]|nr:metallophosphoesterase [Clostridia bacterium]